jgi:AcrR family transcriptional regulator
MHSKATVTMRPNLFPDTRPDYATEILGQQTAAKRRRRHSAPESHGRPAMTDYQPHRTTVEKRRRIRELAAMLFAEKGLHGMSMNALGRAARIPPASMIYHYGKREELLAEIVAEHLHSLNLSICAAADATAGQPAAARLHAMLKAALDDAANRHHAHMLSARGLCALARADQDDMRARIAVMIDTLAEPLLTDGACGPGRTAVIKASVATVFAGIGEAADTARRAGADRNDMARALAAMLIAGGASAASEATGIGPG